MKKLIAIDSKWEWIVPGKVAQQMYDLRIVGRSAAAASLHLMRPHADLGPVNARPLGKAVEAAVWSIFVGALGALAGIVVLCLGIIPDPDASLILSGVAIIVISALASLGLAFSSLHRSLLEIRDRALPGEETLQPLIGHPSGSIEDVQSAIRNWAGDQQISLVPVPDSEILGKNNYQAVPVRAKALDPAPTPRHRNAPDYGLPGTDLP